MRHLWISSMAVLIVASLPTPVHSAFHFMRVSEVMVGAGGDCRIQYVELQMTGTGQRFVGGHSLFFFDRLTGKPLRTVQNWLYLERAPGLGDYDRLKVVAERRTVCKKKT